MTTVARLQASCVAADATQVGVDVGRGDGPHALREVLLPSDAFFYYLRARWDTERAHIDKDIEDYTRAIELAPDFDLAYLYRGKLYYELDDLYAAFQDYTRALELSPDLGAAHRKLTYLYFTWNDWEAATASIQEAIALDECEGGFIRHNIDCAEDYYLLAHVYTSTDYAKGIEAAEKSIEFYPHFPEPYYQLGRFHHLLGDEEKARAYARHYLSFPDSELQAERAQQMRDILLSS